MTNFDVDPASIEQARHRIQSAVTTAAELTSLDATAAIITDPTAVHRGVADALAGFLTDARTLLDRSGDNLRATDDALQRAVNTYIATDIDVRTSITGAGDE